MALSEQAQEIASTIIMQMGGQGRLSAMVGANNYTFDDKTKTLSFRFKGSKVANHIAITLNGSDLYDVKLSKIWGQKITVKKEISDAYDDMLKPFFEDSTGLYLTF